MKTIVRLKRLQAHYNSHFMPDKPITRLAEEALELLAMRIRLHRRRLRMTQQELADRLGVTRRTVRQIEKGAPSVAIGRVLEAAALTGVDLFVPEATTLAPQIDHARNQLALLPTSVRAGPGTDFDPGF